MEMVERSADLFLGALGSAALSTGALIMLLIVEMWPTPIGQQQQSGPFNSFIGGCSPYDCYYTNWKPLVGWIVLPIAAGLTYPIFIPLFFHSTFYSTPSNQYQ